METSKPAYAIGQRLMGTVEKIFPYGVFIRLDNGQPAYMRKRELSWTGDLEPQYFVQEGQRLEAVVTEPPEGDRLLELSLRAKSPDPWEAFSIRFREDDIVTGTVRQLMSYGAFVEILPGINGLVPLTELAPWEVTKSEDILWIGDVVETVITFIDRKAHKVWLSIRIRMEQQAESTPQAKASGPLFEELHPSLGEPHAIFHQEAGIGGELPCTLDIAQRERVGRILVVEDRTEFRENLVTWLERRGYQVDPAATYEEAWLKIQHQTYGVLLVDIDLPTKDGLALIRQVKAENPAIQIAIMSIADWLRERSREIEELNVVEVCEKPLKLEQIESLLTRIGQGEQLSPWRITSAPPRPPEALPLQDIIAAPAEGLSLGEQLLPSLIHLIELARAEVGIIFYANPSSQTVSIIAQAGTTALSQEAIYSLEDSPVKDLMREKKPIFETRVQAYEQVQRRFRKLLDLLPFESCIGVPIEAHNETNHALFLFHRNQEAFTYHRLRDALAAAIFFASVIEREAFGQQVLSLSKFLVSGQLAAGFGHEVYNQMSGLHIQIRNLQTDCRLAEQHIAGLAETSAFQELKQSVDSLLNTSSTLRKTVELFQGLMQAEDNRALVVEDILRTAETLLRPISHRHKVRVTIDSHPSLPPALGSAVRLQQVFLNIMLNAIQHITAKDREGGSLKIMTDYEVGERGPMITIRFCDSGPGIHKQLWEQVFALGFSTRTDGTGLGLFIARSLLNSLGGSIAVERSIVPIGTTFLVQLRTAPSQEANP